MELKIYWTDFSKTQLRDIFEYYKENASLKVAKNITTGIAKETLKLKKQPIQLVRLKNCLLTDQTSLGI